MIWGCHYTLELGSFCWPPNQVTFTKKMAWKKSWKAMGTSHNSLLRPFLAFTFLLAAWVPANTRVVMVWLLSGHVMDPFLSRTRGCFTKACDQACEVESSCGNKIDIQNKHCNYIFRSYILIYFVEKTYTKVNKTASMIYIYIYSMLLGQTVQYI